jgi:glycosylphosphatidylinositol phospholipase D
LIRGQQCIRWRLRLGASLVAAGLACASASLPAFEPEIALNALDGGNGFVLRGIDPNDWSGRAVRGAGDVNGDGIDDLLIGAPFGSPDGRSGAGESYVVFGTAAGFPAIFELSALDGTNGVVLNGVNPDDRSGGAVSRGGDVNGDGIGDVIVGARLADPDGKVDAGEGYVVFGSASGLPAVVELGALDGAIGFVLKGADAGEFAGQSVSNAGDVNGDGVEDLIVGAYGASPGGRSGAGKGYVVFGSLSGFPAVLELSALDGTNGFTLNGVDPGDQAGYAVSGAGDVNADGLGDILIGATGAAPDGKAGAGESYIVFGKPGGFPATIELSALDGSNGLVLKGVDPGDGSGWSLSGPGDVNGDGVQDILVGARDADAIGNPNSGESYVVFGTASGFPATVELAALDGGDGFALAGAAPDNLSGASVSGVGDLNSDGVQDLLIGAPNAAPDEQVNSGASYVVFGSAAGFPDVVRLSELNSVNGFVLKGANPFDISGHAVSGAGDVNGDGIADLVIGAPFADPDGKAFAGETYVVFGQSRVIRGVSTGVLLTVAVCYNRGTAQTVLDLPPFAKSSWACTEEGLQASPGDIVSVRLLAWETADAVGRVMGGELTGMTPLLAVCRNVTTGQRVAFALAEPSWDCANRGLQAAPFNIIDMQIFGRAQ